MVRIAVLHVQPRPGLGHPSALRLDHQTIRPHTMPSIPVGPSRQQQVLGRRRSVDSVQDSALARNRLTSFLCLGDGDAGKVEMVPSSC